MTIYRTRFHLTAPVNNVSAAQAYLSSDNMAQYLCGEVDTIHNDEIKRVEWTLCDEDSGCVELEFTRELTMDESQAVSRWISGQNSDGLGEGFEQQEFAIPVSDEDCEGCEYENDCFEHDPKTCGEIDYKSAEFDWRTNNYVLQLAG